MLSTTDAANWTHHGARLSIGAFGWAGADAWASEVEQRNGGITGTPPSTATALDG